MFSSIGTKLALRKAGISAPIFPSSSKSESENGTGFENPFANVQWGVPKVFTSWTTPAAPQTPVRAPPVVGESAQTHAKLRFPATDGKPCVVFFMRYCGCPFTEKLFLHMRSLANRYTSINFIAVSHCTPNATEEWTKKLGGAWNVKIVVDGSRELYALWGLGISNWGHLLHPRNGYNQYMLGKTEGVWGQQVGEGGCRWQTGGAYAVDERGVVRWGGPMNSVDEKVPIEDGIKALEIGNGPGARPGIF